MYSKTELIDALSRVASRTAGSLTQSDYAALKDDHHPAFSTIMRNFGGWNAAKERAGLETVEVGQCTPNKIPINESFFESIETQTQAYWLGFILADGHVGDKGFKLEIQKRDSDHLHRFKSDIESEHKIAEDGGSVRIRTRNSQFIKTLKQKGFDNKTFSESLPDVPTELRPHFIRGLYDGDGSFYVYGVESERFSIEIAGHGPRLEILGSWIPFDTSVYYKKNVPTEQHAVLHLGGDAAESFAGWIYPDGRETAPALDRKIPPNI